MRGFCVSLAKQATLYRRRLDLEKEEAPQRADHLRELDNPVLGLCHNVSYLAEITSGNHFLAPLASCYDLFGRQNRFEIALFPQPLGHKMPASVKVTRYRGAMFSGPSNFGVLERNA